AGRLELRRDLEEQSALTDPGLTAHEHERAGHHAPAEHVIELGQSRGPAGGRLPLHGRQPDRCRSRLVGAAGGPPAHAAARAAGPATPMGDRLLYQRVPRFAGGTLSLPAERFIAAFRTEVRGPQLRHAHEYPGAPQGLLQLARITLSRGRGVRYGTV